MLNTVLGQISNITTFDSNENILNVASLPINVMTLIKMIYFCGATGGPAGSEVKPVVPKLSPHTIFFSRHPISVSQQNVEIHRENKIFFE